MSGSVDRVIVSLDAASDDRMVLDTAARVAAHLKVPLHGIFVEDEDILHLAALPFARQVTPLAGAQPFTSEQAHLQLRAAADRARRELTIAAKRHRVKHSFEIITDGAQNALSAATDSDVVVVGAETRPVAGHFRVERRWSAWLANAPGPFLLARHSWAEAGLVVALLRDRTPSSVRLLATAGYLAAARDSRLTVICAAALVSKAGFMDWLNGKLATLPVHAEIEIAAAASGTLHERLLQLQCRLLAVEMDEAERFDERLTDLARRFSCDILVIR